MSKNEKRGETENRTHHRKISLAAGYATTTVRKDFFFPLQNLRLCCSYWISSLQLRDQVSSAAFILFFFDMKRHGSCPLLWKSQLFSSRCPSSCQKTCRASPLKRSNSGTTSRGSQTLDNNRNKNNKTNREMLFVCGCKAACFAIEYVTNSGRPCHIKHTCVRAAFTLE